MFKYTSKLQYQIFENKKNLIESIKYINLKFKLVYN